jgi:hypothetical protein
MKTRTEFANCIININFISHVYVLHPNLESVPIRILRGCSTFRRQIRYLGWGLDPSKC